jgi:class 3 adenylate cyclase/tetratricopeptide (TPR) repeat protein
MMTGHSVSALMGLPDLPEGPVTLMLTDIEGSTALRTTLGDPETDALFHECDELIRQQIEDNKGQDQKAALGDGFLAVFVSTRRALACAIGIQRALDSFNLNRVGRALRVRIGLNTGEVAWQDGQLSGEAAHAAARVCAEASGGQILVSDVTRQLAGTVADVTFHDTGEHELKGFPEPWRLWEVVWVRETTQVPHQVFVGREAEMAALRSKLVAALDGNGGLVLIGGEPGVGKTTLVRQLIREAEQRGALAVFGRCYESEGAVPYSPFVEMLEQALAIMPPDVVREDLGDDAPEIARMVPELRRRFPDIGDPLELPPEQQRRYFFNAVASFIARASTRFPLMLVADDVHWADEPTLLLIEHMAAVVPDLRVLALGTYRDVELDVARPLAATLERLVRARTAERLSVKRLDRSGVALMLEGLAGKAPPEAIVGAIFAETEGNPFFVEEVFRHLVEEGKVFDDAGAFRTDLEVDELDVPESVRLVVGRRLERLGAEAQKVLAAGAVVGRAFPFALLEEITDTDTDRLLDMVEEAEAAKVIVPEERDGDVHYSFAHELIRQTLLAQLSLLRRQRLHLAVADAIERTDSTAATTRPSELAHHLLQAGAGAATGRTVSYLERTADRAMQAAAFEEALRAIDDALSLVGDDDTGRRGRLLERKGWAVRALGNFEECLAIWEDVLPIYQQIGDVETAAHLCHEMGYQLQWLNRFADATAIYVRGIELLGDHRSPTRVTLVSATAQVMGITGLFDEAEAQFSDAAAIAREFADDRALGDVEWGRTVSRFFNARLADAVESGRTSIEHLRRAHDLWMLADGLAWTSFALVFSGFPGEARRLAAEAVELGMKLGHQGAELLGRRGVWWAEICERGDLEEYERGAREDLDRFETIRSPWVSQSHGWMASTLMLRGDLEGSLHHAEAAITLEPVSGWAGLGWSGKFLNRALAGEVETCRMLLSEQRGVLPHAGEAAPGGRTTMLNAAAHGCAVVGMADEAGALYPLVAERVDVLPILAFDAALAQRVAGMAAAAAGLWDEAQGHYETARSQSEEFPNRLERAQVLHWYGKMLLDRADPADHERARTMLADALDDYNQFGMPVHAAMTQALLE